MNIESLCEAVKTSMPILKDARVGRVIDHSLVERFQESIKDNLNGMSSGYVWEIEKKAKGRLERDSIDILGKGSDFDLYSEENIAEIEWKLNHRSRKSLGYLTPLDYFKKLYNFDFGSRCTSI